jgi:hypothetical protein
MKNLLILLTLFGNLVFSTGTSNATVYYISTSGSDSNPGTIDQPFKTFNRLATLNLVAGDIVYILAGTYLSGRTSGGNGFNISNKSGTQANPITISAYPADFPNGGRVVLDCSDFTGTSSFFGANITNCPWFIFRGIRITNIPQRVAGQINPGWLISNSSSTVLDNCEADHCGYSGFMLGNSNNVTYINCDSHANDNPFDSGVQKHGGSDGFARTSSDNTSTNTHYIKCRSWFNADDGWDCFDTNGTIFYDSCWAFWNGYRADVFPLSHCNGSDCWGDGNGFKMGGANTNVTGSITRFITNCVAFQNFANGFDQNAGHFVGQAYNNIAWSNGGVGFALAYYSGLAMVLKNNIAYQNGFNIPQTGNVSSWVQSNNTWNSGFSVSSSDFISLTNAGVDGARQANGDLPNLTFLRLASTSSLLKRE